MMDEAGVYRIPGHGPAGELTYMAVNGRGDRIAQEDVPAGRNPQPTIDALWRLVDRYSLTPNRRRVADLPGRRTRTSTPGRRLLEVVR